MEKSIIEFKNIPFVKAMSLIEIWRIISIKTLLMENSNDETFPSLNQLDYVAFLNLKILEVLPKTSIFIKDGDYVKFVYTKRYYSFEISLKFIYLDPKSYVLRMTPY